MELTEEIWKSGKSNIMVENMKYNRYIYNSFKETVLVFQAIIHL